jgi:hypothetical protein
MNHFKGIFTGKKIQTHTHKQTKANTMRKKIITDQQHNVFL